MPANISVHYDPFDNLAYVVAGRRRYALYAPDLISKLYVGPIDNTMPSSLVGETRQSARRDFQ